MHEYLDTHPEICMSAKKEPHFFSRTDVRQQGRDWYNSLWGHADAEVRYFGESSTSYCIDSVALERIEKEVINPKLILILRDPVERLLSHYQWMYAQGLERYDLPRALAKENKQAYSADEHLSGCYNTYRRCSHYSFWVPRIWEQFGRENVLLLTTEALSKDPGITLANSYSFLGVSAFAFEREVRANQTSDKTVPRLNSLSKVYAKLPVKLRETIRPLAVLAKAKAGRRKLRVPDCSESQRALVEELLIDDINFYSKIV